MAFIMIRSVRNKLQIVHNLNVNIIIISLVYKLGLRDTSTLKMEFGNYLNLCRNFICFCIKPSVVYIKLRSVTLFFLY